MERTDSSKPFGVFVAGVAVAALVAAACSSRDAASSVTEVVVLSDGAGPPNAEPVWPLKPGWQFHSGFFSTDAVLEAREVDGRTVLPLSNSTRIGPNLIQSPGEPGCIRYLSVDDDGVWYVGAPREGLLEEGALLVPREVRVGKKWETRLGGKVRYSGEVMSRTEEDTLFGRRAVWMLRLTDHRALTYEGQDARSVPRKNGLAFALRLVEGRGPDDFGQLTSCRPWDPVRLGDLGGQTVIVPLDDDPRARVTAPEVVLAPLGTAPLTERFLPWAAGLYPDPQDPTSRVITLRGRFPFFGQYLIGDAEVGFDAGGGWSDVPGMRCAHWRGDTITPFRSDETCTSPDAVLVTRDGAFSALPIFAEGSPLQRELCVGDCERVYHEFIGIFEGADGLPRALSWGDEGLLESGRYEQGTLTNGSLSYVDERFDVYPGYAGLFDVPTSQLVWPRLHEDGTLSLVEFADDYRSPSSRVAFAHLPAPGRIRARHLAYVALERPATVVEPGDRAHYVFGAEGLLRRVHIGRDGIELEPVARVRLPNDDLLTTAFVAGDEIIALSQRNFRGYDAWFRPDGYVPEEAVELGEVYAWRGALPPPSPKGKPSAYFGLEVQVVQQDVRLCWPPGAGTPEVTTFTLGGRTPAAVVAFDHCVLLVREAAPQEELEKNSAWTVEGEIPGAGRVAIGIGPDQWRRRHTGDGFEHGYSSPIGFPVAGGGSVAHDRTHGPGLTVPQRLFFDNTGRFAPDLAGQGLWIYRPRWMEHSVSLIGPEGDERRIDLEPYIAPRYPIPDVGGGCGRATCWYDVEPVPVPGGGVAIGNLRVTPDGTVTELAEPWRTADDRLFEATAVGADGAFCGRRGGDGAVCRGAGGEALPTPGVEPTIATETAFWGFTTNDAGQMILQRVHRADGAVSTFETPVNATEFERDDLGVAATTITYDPSGVPYVLFNNRNGHWLWRLDDAEPTPVELSELSLFLPGQTLTVLVEQDLFVFKSLVRYGDPELEFMGLRYQQSLVRVPRRGR